MNKPNVSKMVQTTKVWTSKHSPDILTGLGIAGMVTTTVLAVKATPKALSLIEAKKREEDLDDLTAMETIKTTWKCYIPAVATGTFSAACLIGANSVNARRNAALAAAYKLSETALTEYREKVVETIGEKKEKTVRDKVAKSKIEKKPVDKNNIVITNSGETLCMESISGRYFKSDIDKIKKAVNKLNARMLREGYISLTEFYNEIELEATTVSDDLGWNVDRGLIELYFSSQLSPDDIPCVVIDYDTPPTYKFNNFA